jgi:hypothetical protein
MSPCLPRSIQRLAAATGAVLAALAAPAAAQEPDSVFAEMVWLLEQRRSPTSAAILEFVVPVLGYRYAGNWKRGLLPAVPYVAGAVLTNQHTRCVAEQLNDPSRTCNETEASIGGLLWLGSRVWAGAEVHRLTVTRNRDITERLMAVSSTTRPGELLVAADAAKRPYREPIVAGAMEWFIPFLGYAYAGDERAGVYPNLVLFGGIGLMIAALGCDVDDWAFDCETMFGVGASAAVVGKVWAVVGAGRAASRRNSGPRTLPEFGIVPTRGGGWGLELRTVH